MSLLFFALRRAKSSVTPKASLVRWFRKDDDDGGIADNGGSWAERERALEGVYIRRLDHENIERLKRKLAKKRDCEREDDEETENEQETKKSGESKEEEEQ